MYNTYSSSTLLSLKSKGSFSFSFNDHSSLLNERFDKTTTSSSSSSSSCSCCSCCCCAFATHNRLPVHPSYLYGLRQSTLIQCSPSRRLILGGGDRYFCRFPVYDLDRGGYEVSCSVKRSNDSRGFGRRRQERFRPVVSEGKIDSYLFGDFDVAEAVISLLNEEFSEEYLRGAERNEKLAKRLDVEKREDRGCEFYRGKKNKVNVAKREDCGREVYRGEKNKVQVEKRENYGGDGSRQRKENAELNLLESDSKCEFESTIKLREEGYRMNEESEAIRRGKNHRGRSKSASSSSYNSFASSEAYESDKEARDEEGEFVKEPFSRFEKDSNRDGVEEEYCRHTDDAEGHGEVLEHKYAEGGSCVEWDCRKTSEKKLTEVAPKETQSIKESSEIRLRRGRMHETDYAKASASRKQLSDVEKKSSLAVNFDKETEKQYNQMGAQVRKQYNQMGAQVRKQNNQMGVQDTIQSESRWKSEEIRNTVEIHGIDAETTLQSQNQFSGRRENLRRSEHQQTTGLISRNDDLRTNLHQGSRTSEILDIDGERISNLQRHSESIMKIREEDMNLLKSSIHGTEEQYQQRDERIIGQVDLRAKPEHISEVSVPHDTDSRRSSIVQSETRMKNLEEHTRLVSISYPEAKGQQSQIDHRHQERTRSRKGLQDSTSLSVVQASDMNIYTESQRTAEKRITNQESTLTSVVKPIGETSGRHKQTDEKITQITSHNEAQKPTRLSTFVKSSEDSSSLQSSSNLLSQAGVQQIYVEEEERNSQVILMPPPSQLVARGSVHSDQTSGIAVQEVSSKSSESGSSIFHTYSGGRTPDLRDGWGEASDEPLNLISPEDALGSAQRLEESSMQFVGEFVEKASHEASTSEMQKEKKAAEMKVIYEGEKQLQKNSGQYGSEDLGLKGWDSRQSPESSGTKGPLDLISREDDLDSAHRFEESSMHFVGEFAEKARHGVSTSEMQKEKKASEEKVMYEGEMQWKKNSGQYASQDLQLKRRESKQSSEGSGAKGPSDEMWDVTDPSVQPPETEALKGNVAAGTAIVKKSSKSLWTIMANIVRLQWGSHTETPTAAARSEGKSSSNESISSETWFSGRESDKNSDENVKRERRGMLQEATPSLQPNLRKTYIETQGEASDTVRSMDKVKQLESDRPSSSEGISSNFGEEIIGEKNIQGTASGMDIVPSSSKLSAGIVGRPPIVEKISETERSETSESGLREQLAQSSVRLAEVSGSASKDGDLKQKKLQRNKQVLRDRFDEWEEAYKLESEQRKIDEIFMREALLEAKKAADTWEVPVGAVLVQHGKIIARGCNLVEELRDSTAHAEMICIREASNVLRTWRLAETTLYVTLEPCPMCAGAILQARIPSLVWGAPNKLLGADGSWVSLFPDGRGGKDDSAPSDKPPAPVHPFHPNMTIRRGVLATECADIMQQFFQLRRRKKANVDPTPPPSCLPIANHPSKLITKMQHMFHMMFCL